MRSVSDINSTKINDSEYTFLRSYALGLSGDPVPIKKVRIREVYTTDVNIKKGLNQHVIPRNNHHVLV